MGSNMFFEHVYKIQVSNKYKKDLSFSIRKDLFFFVSQRKNAIITRFVKYGGLEQILILISKTEV